MAASADEEESGDDFEANEEEGQSGGDGASEEEDQPAGESAPGLGAAGGAVGAAGWVVPSEVAQEGHGSGVPLCSPSPSPPPLTAIAETLLMATGSGGRGDGGGQAIVVSGKGEWGGGCAEQSGGVQCLSCVSRVGVHAGQTFAETKRLIGFVSVAARKYLDRLGVNGLQPRLIISFPSFPQAKRLS